MALLKVKTRDGWVEGIPAGNQSISLFRGIPYAAPPVGALRWKKPERVQPWDGVLPCYKFQNICWQRRVASEGSGLIAREFYCLDHPRSEDCLQLNIWTPARSADEALPVAVYLHGGGYSTGYGFLNCYDGEAMAKRGVVFITVCHRLNVFGYLAHPWLGAEDGGISGNYGLYDLIAALQWIQENAEAFGGDKNRVTVFGQSGGGEKVRHLLASPLARGLFSKAIMQSGGGLQDFAPELTLAQAEERGRAFFDFCGFRSLEEARAMDAEELLKKCLAFNDLEGARHFDPLIPLFEAFQPIVDGVLLPDSPRRIFLRGDHPDMPTMVGCTAQEFYQPIKELPTPEQVLERGARYYGADRAETFAAAVHIRDDKREAERVLGNVVGEQMFASDLGWLENQLKTGHKPAYGYYLTLVPTGAETAHHSAEHHYVFQTLYRSDRPYTGRDYDLSNQLCDYWTNFMKYGDPNGKSGGVSVGVPLPEWTPYTAESEKLMEINYDLRMTDVPEDDYARFVCAEILTE